MVKRFRCHDGSVIIGPSAYHGVQLFDEFPLCRAFVPFDDSSHFCNVSLDGLSTRFDEGFEPKWWPILICPSRVGFPYWKLTHREPQKIEAHLTLVLPQRVGDSRLTWF
jgi:hypothetical protein